MKQGLELAAHERFDLHEIITVKTVGATKAAAMSKFVQDEDLKGLLYAAFTGAQEQLRELAELERTILHGEDVAPPKIH